MVTNQLDSKGRDLYEVLARVASLALAKPERCREME